MLVSAHFARCCVLTTLTYVCQRAVGMVFYDEK